MVQTRPIGKTITSLDNLVDYIHAIKQTLPKFPKIECPDVIIYISLCVAP
jgi:hypothetical protein